MTDFDQHAAAWDANPYRIERARVIAQGIQSAVPLTQQMSAFEYGCGTGLLSFALQSYLGQITLADNSSGMLAVLDEKIAAARIHNMVSLKVDLSTDPLPPVRVQLIYTLMTLHHIRDFIKVLQAFYALLDGSGYLCVADLDTEDGSFHGAENLTVHKGFDRSEFGNIVRQTGFHNVQFSTIFQSSKVVGTETKHFPVFLMVAEK
ncbi:MAG: class I SAM-dependent methyltransferase [Anaerolineaceae bacterium]|nr:class I SAM-dependent methyltransferase [Anaerolineaceae bacterium]